MDQSVELLPGKKPTCILVLQGVGAFQALREYAIEPDWVCGISIGAINGAIIAGNTASRRLEQLDQFWDLISRPG